MTTDHGVIMHRLTITTYLDQYGEEWTGVNSDGDVSYLTALGMLEHAKHLFLTEGDDDD